MDADNSQNPLQIEVAALLQARDLRALRDLLCTQLAADIADLIKEHSDEEKAVIFRILPRELATDTFEYLDFDKQKSLLNALGDGRVAIILNDMSPDDRTALLEEFPASAAKQLVMLLNKEERQIALTLLGYPENSVGRLMNPDYIAIAEDWSVEVVLAHIRKIGQSLENINVLYVLNGDGKLIQDLRIRDIILAEPDTIIRDLLINGKVVSLLVSDDQEKAVDVFKRYDRAALPVVDSNGLMIGIITVDDVLDIAEAEATEDIQKLGAVEALEDQYIKVPIYELIQKRAGWLILLFLGEMLTASAMSFYESEIERAVILALFIPLIISSGGNSGSQAATLVIRALALGEIRPRDWKKILGRELISGIVLGGMLGLIGFIRIAVLSHFYPMYGQHSYLLGLTVGLSLILVVLWGVITGAMLPLILKRAGLDPATSSAPFVATLVDVTGLVIYFSVAALFLKGTLL